MRHVPTLLGILLLALLLPAQASADDKLTMKLFAESWFTPSFLPAAKADLVRSGITLQDLVVALGPVLLSLEAFPEPRVELPPRFYVL